ncbi:hypothetical protein BC828DRAFT_385730 [Blastocladiella britannica]|nr:hypothetical protein BC828DRAFT_385730 [Blastocladiella britannica]
MLVRNFCTDLLCRSQPKMKLRHHNKQTAHLPEPLLRHLGFISAPTEEPHHTLPPISLVPVRAALEATRAAVRVAEKRGSADASSVRTAVAYLHAAGRTLVPGSRAASAVARAALLMQLVETSSSSTSGDDTEDHDDAPLRTALDSLVVGLGPSGVAAALMVDQFDSSDNNAYDPTALRDAVSRSASPDLPLFSVAGADAEQESEGGEIPHHQEGSEVDIKDDDNMSERDLVSPAPASE